MEKIKFVANQNVTKPHYTIEVSAKDLYLLGWDFEEDIQNQMNSDNLLYGIARLRVLSTPVRFHFEQNQAGENIYFWYFSVYGAEYRYNTAGVNPPIEDLLTLVNNGLYSSSSIVDYSEDEEKKLCGFLTTEIF